VFFFFFSPFIGADQLNLHTTLVRLFLELVYFPRLAFTFQNYLLGAKRVVLAKPASRTERLRRAKRASSEFQFAILGFTLLTKHHKFINL